MLKVVCAIAVAAFVPIVSNAKPVTLTCPVTTAFRPDEKATYSIVLDEDQQTATEIPVDGPNASGSKHMWTSKAAFANGRVSWTVDNGVMPVDYSIDRNTGRFTVIFERTPDKIFQSGTCNIQETKGNLF